MRDLCFTPRRGNPVKKREDLKDVIREEGSRGRKLPIDTNAIQRTGRKKRCSIAYLSARHTRGSASTSKGLGLFQGGNRSCTQRVRRCTWAAIFLVSESAWARSLGVILAARSSISVAIRSDNSSNRSSFGRLSLATAIGFLCSAVILPLHCRLQILMMQTDFGNLKIHGPYTRHTLIIGASVTGIDAF